MLAGMFKIKSSEYIDPEFLVQVKKMDCSVECLNETDGELNESNIDDTM